MYTLLSFLRVVLLLTSWSPAAPRNFLPPDSVQKMSVAELSAYIAHSEHPIIVNFWATYCSPCLTEVPYLQQVAAGYREKHVELILVSLDREEDYPGHIIDFAVKKGFTARKIWLSKRMSTEIKILIDRHWSGGLPSTLFINNASDYRRFYDRQLTALQVEPAIKEMLK